MEHAGCGVADKDRMVGRARSGFRGPGAIELLMPALHPIELWQESGRYGNMGGILMEFKISGDRHVTLGPTHEEVVTDQLNANPAAISAEEGSVAAAFSVIALPSKPLLATVPAKLAVGGTL